MKRRKILHDAGLKILALIMALAAFVHVFSLREREMEFRVPLSIQPLPEGLAWASDLPAETQILVRATGRELLKLKAGSFGVGITLDSPRPGTIHRPILASDVQFPRGVSPLSVSILSPRTLQLQVERAATMRCPVAVRVEDPFAGGRALLEWPASVPSFVEVRGPESILQRLDSIRTEPISLEDRGGEPKRVVPLVPPAHATLAPRTVEVEIATGPIAERLSGPIPIAILSSGVSRQIELRPDSGRVRILGAAERVQAIRLDRARLQVDLRRSPAAAAARVAAHLPRPPGSVIRVAAIPESVEVRTGPGPSPADP